MQVILHECYLSCSFVYCDVNLFCQLHLYDVEDLNRSTILNYCAYVQVSI